jgi:hypothetical protein
LRGFSPRKATLRGLWLDHTTSGNALACRQFKGRTNRFERFDESNLHSWTS